MATRNFLTGSNWISAYGVYTLYLSIYLFIYGVKTAFLACISLQ